eukprot:JP446074.1.p1 GENE.JP446074.1~~JP446074.1.p1  ORF type:complete len:383 (-),score=78.28 JP446074.1:272-1420(-)
MVYRRRMFLRRALFCQLCQPRAPYLLLQPSRPQRRRRPRRRTPVPLRHPRASPIAPRRVLSKGHHCAAFCENVNFDRAIVGTTQMPVFSTIVFSDSVSPRSNGVPCGVPSTGQPSIPNEGWFAEACVLQWDSELPLCSTFDFEECAEPMDLDFGSDVWDCDTPVALPSALEYESAPRCVNLDRRSNFLFPSTQSFRMSKLMRTQSSGVIANALFSSSHNFTTRGLSASAQKLLFMENAGGNSEVSEALSFEVLRLSFGATLAQTEMELEYFPEGSKRTDYSCDIFGQRIGVSVTRAMKNLGVFTAGDAFELLYKKLYGVHASTHAICNDTWHQQVLHIWAQTRDVARTLLAVYEALDSRLKGNTIVVVTVALEAHWVFDNRF